VTLAVAGALAACSPAGAPEPTVTTLKASGGVPGNWDPISSFTYALQQQAIYESFVYLDTTAYEWKPQLAEEFQISEDLRTMHIKLRENVDFTDGTHLDAEGAKTSFDYVMSPDTVYHTVLTQQYLPEVVVTGEYELEITTVRPMTAEFMFWFALVPLASPTVIENDPSTLATTPVGTGPYIIADQVPEVSITFERNSSYRDPDAFPFDSLEFTAMDDSIAVQNALKSGQLNLGTVDAAYAADLENAGFSLSFGKGGGVCLMFPDATFASAPELADVRVRQAIAYAIDREGITENLEYGYGTATSQVWGEGSPYYIEGGDDDYAFDPDKARELMADAGFADGLVIKMPNGGLYDKYEPVVTQSLADIGITIDDSSSFPDILEYYTAVNSGDFGLALRDCDEGFNAVFRIDLPNGGYPELNELYDLIDNGTADEIQEAEQAVGQYLLDAVPVVVVSRPSIVWASIPEITVAGPAVVTAPTPLSSIQLRG
jgi:peptide/nickel transport system substrate-binding protein